MPATVAERVSCATGRAFLRGWAEDDLTKQDYLTVMRSYQAANLKRNKS